MEGYGSGHNRIASKAIWAVRLTRVRISPPPLNMKFKDTRRGRVEVERACLEYT